MDIKNINDKFESEIDPIIRELDKAKPTDERMPIAQEKVTMLSRKYTAIAQEPVFYKIFYAQAMIDYYNVRDDLARASLETATRIYGGAFEGYNDLMAHLTPLPVKNKNSKKNEYFGLFLFGFGLMALIGAFLGFLQNEPVTSTEMGSVVLDIILIVIGAVVYFEYRQS